MFLSVVVFLGSAELTAGSIYVRTESTSHCRAYAFLFKRLRKARDGFFVGSRKFGLGYGIYGDKIYVNRKRLVCVSVTQTGIKEICKSESGFL